jgi:hypothetical protein
MRDGLHARTVLQAAVYNKTLRISNEARLGKDGVADKLTNLQSADCRMVRRALQWGTHNACVS